MVHGLQILCDDLSRKYKYVGTGTFMSCHGRQTEKMFDFSPKIKPPKQKPKKKKN